MTDKKVAEYLSSMVIVVDTREKVNQHILEFFDNSDIAYVEEKLDSADYSVRFNCDSEVDYNYCVLVERKNSFDEIIGNFTKNRARFAREFERINTDQRVSIVIETASWLKLFRGSYRSKLPPKALIASLFTWVYRYNCPIFYASKNESPEVIYWLLYYGAMETLKGDR